MGGVTLIYVTASSEQEARNIGSSLVESRLAACANIFPSITSFFHWEGGVQEEKEAVLILKTRQSLASDVITKVTELHSYDCPAVLSIRVDEGNQNFLNWVDKETT
jgi:periplasmic divalent cation tolerance protein